MSNRQRPKRTHHPLRPWARPSLRRDHCPDCHSERLQWRSLASALASSIAVDVANLIDGQGVVSADVWCCRDCGSIGVVEHARPLW